MLDGTQVDKIRLVLSSTGWNDVMKPALLNRGKNAVKALCVAPSEREGEFKGSTDEALRAAIRETEWMVSVWSNEIVIFEHNRRLEEESQNGSPAANP
jgi:hypothetical protein